MPDTHQMLSKHTHGAPSPATAEGGRIQRTWRIPRSYPEIKTSPCREQDEDLTRAVQVPQGCNLQSHATSRPTGKTAQCLWKTLDPMNALPSSTGADASQPAPTWTAHWDGPRGTPGHLLSGQGKCGRRTRAGAHSRGWEGEGTQTASRAGGAEWLRSRAARRGLKEGASATATSQVGSRGTATRPRSPG